MHEKIIHIDRVFDVQRQRRGRGGPPCTNFGIEEGGTRHFSILVDGYPSLQEGRTVTALFRKPNDWQELIGWVDNQSGDIVLADPPATLAAVVAVGIVEIAWLVFLLNEFWIFTINGRLQLALLGGTAFLIALFLLMAMRWKMYRDDSSAICQLRGRLTRIEGVH